MIKNLTPELIITPLNPIKDNVNPHLEFMRRSIVTSLVNRDIYPEVGTRTWYASEYELYIPLMDGRLLVLEQDNFDGKIYVIPDCNKPLTEVRGDNYWNYDIYRSIAKTGHFLV